jgi:MYXO-CTERM domain-containing protein
MRCEISSLGEPECHLGQGVGATTQILASGGGGCACTLADADSGWEGALWLLGLGLAIMGSRIRRRRPRKLLR